MTPTANRRATERWAAEQTRQVYQEAFQKREPQSFPLWYDLQQFILNGHRPKAMEKRLIAAAKEWLPQYRFYWQGGACLVDAPYGEYIWSFVVEIEQQKIWNFPEFQEGYRFGLAPVKPYRDANPFNEPARRSSWDCGYILGTEKRHRGE